jgi:ferritin-like metal-binding protein YciE
MEPVMKMFSNRADVLHLRYVDSLKKALDMEQRIVSEPVPVLDPTTDRQLADEFRNYLKQTECHLARIEGLLRRHASHAGA